MKRKIFNLISLFGGIAVGTIREAVSGAGVTIDGILLKDFKIKLGSIEIHTGAGVPNGNLTGALTTTVAVYVRNDAADADTIIYGTRDTGANWVASRFTAG